MMEDTTYRLGQLVPIPELNACGLLPKGEYTATLDDIRERYAYRYGRQVVFEGLERVVDRLRANNVTEIFVDGSFVTDKERPSDVDVCYTVPAGADPESWGLLAPSRRQELHDKERVDLLPAVWRVKQDFQRTWPDRKPKGIIRLVENDEGGTS